MKCKGANFCRVLQREISGVLSGDGWSMASGKKFKPFVTIRTIVLSYDAPGAQEEGL